MMIQRKGRLFMELISIVVPCYNVEDKIKRCIDSIKNQTFSNFKAILVDDGSIDNTNQIIKKEIVSDERFIYIYKDNGGQASARNLGISMANSEYITFIDSDDYIREDYLKDLIEPLINDKELDMTACFFERIYESKVSLNMFNEKDLYFSKYPAVWGKVFKTSIIKGNNVSFPESLWYEDLCFFTILIGYCKKIKVIEKPLYYYMQNPNSTMYTYSNKIFDIYKVFDIIKQNIDNSERIEYIMIYHILIGTIFRASFKPNFNKKELSEICYWMEKQFPLWYANPNIKSQMPLFYRIYLYFINKKAYGFVTFIIKRFNKYLSL